MTSLSQNKGRRAGHYGGLLSLLWLLFLVRGSFYSVVFPLWEGMDEWAHFSVISHLGATGAWPNRTDLVPPAIRRSLELVPLSASASVVSPLALTHDAYWMLPEEERRRREQMVAELPQRLTSTDERTDARQYEAQQTPLYYVLLAPVWYGIQRQPLPLQVLILRLCSVLIASLCLPAAYAVAVCIFRDHRMGLLAATMIVASPGLLVDVSRVGNECSTIALVSLAILLTVRTSTQDTSASQWLLLGIALGAALLSKAYALAFLPMPVVAVLVRLWVRRDQPRRVLGHAGLCMAVIFAVAGWWYIRAWMETGTLTGEQINRAAAGSGTAAKLSAATRMNWIAAIDIAAFSHIWVGGWSFLVVRSWMYRVPELLGITAVIGLLRCVNRWSRDEIAAIVPVTAAWLLPLLAAAWYAIGIWQTKGVVVMPGWYLYAAVAAEAVLLTLGLAGLAPGRKTALVVVVAITAFVVLDLYTTESVLIPYYTGFIKHRPNGHLENVAPGVLVREFPEMLRRLAVQNGRTLAFQFVAGLWASYVCATLCLAALAWSLAPARSDTAGHLAASDSVL